MFLCLAHRLVVGSFPLLFCLLAYILLAPVFCSTALAAAPLAGTTIENQATATYTITNANPALNRSETIQSNAVRVVVQPVESLSLVTSQQLVRSPGAAAAFAHTLTNTGNTPLSAALTITTASGSSFTLSALSIVQDLNRNGIADSGEPVVPQGGLVSLTPGAAISLIVTGAVPASATLGQSSAITLSAVSTIQSSTATVVDLVAVNTAALLQVSKQASTYSPSQGQQVTFFLTAANNGNGVAVGGTPNGGQPLLVNGSANQLVLVRDIIPSNTRYVPGSLAMQTGGTLLYHKSGDPPFSYLTSEPASVDEVAYAVSSLPAGQIGAFSFKVEINSNASGSIANTGHSLYRDNNGSQTLDTPSNTATLSLPPLPTVLKYYSNDTFTTPTEASHLGSPLFVQATAPTCNADPLVAEERTIIITSALSRDEESFVSLETGPNTGIFRLLSLPTRDAATNAVVKGDEIIEALKHDLLTATISGCGGGSVSARLLIDPGGVVFDSRTNQPVAGATVTLIDVSGAGNGGAAGGPAKVFDVDGTTSMPSTVTTGADGSFDFPLVGNSTYMLVVKSPNGWTFPSQFTTSQLPGSRIIDTNGSYGRNFSVSAATGPMHLDIPVDPGPAGGLFVQKSASRTTAEIADFIDYSITVKNSSGKILSDVVLNDSLPFGFSYQRGTARRDGAVIVDPDGGVGPRLAYRLGELAAGASTTITYRLKIGPGALRGDGVNRAQATAAFGTVSNVATAAVTVVPGVFTDKGIIIGKFFVDCDRSRTQGAKEPGVPGVRIYLEDGTYAITDSEGKYSFYGISPRTHVLKVDETTLPAGSELIALTNRQAGDAASSFVDLKNGEMHRADFAEGSCTAELLTMVRMRRLKGELFVPETSRGVDAKLTFEQPALQASDVKSRPASGLLGGDTKLPNFSPVMSPDESPRIATDAPDQHVAAAQLQDYTESLTGMDSKPGFIDLKDGDVLPIAQATIRVKGSSVAALKLLVNGEPIGENRIGKKIIVEDQKLEAREYIGIPFKPGKNRLELTQTDPFGNPRGSAIISVTAPDRLARILIQAPGGDLSADGQTPLIVRVRLTDDKGVPVTSRTPLTLESSLGRWDVKDLSDQEPGVQVFMEGGQAEYPLIAPAEPGIALVKATSGTITSQQNISFIPNLRPLIAFGVIEGTLNLRRLDLGAISPAHSQDGFEQELTTISTGDDKRFSASGRAAFFLKGKIKGDYLLTMSYDSDKDTREKLFRDISPDEFYPVYGDSSIRGFDAQSTGKFYVRVDKNRSYLLYGDFTTQSGNSEVRTLGAYNRSLTGVRSHYENSFLSVNGFASQDKSRQVIDEIPALGVSGPYFLTNADIIDNSEKVEIITRDRNQPSLIIKSVPMTRFSDYEIEALTGRILFREAVSSRDSNLNLVSIRITYEVSQSGPDYWVAGGDLQLKLHERLEVGGNYVRDENPLDRQELGSVNATVKLAEKTFLLAEWAHMSRQLSGVTGTSGQGDGKRIELRHDSERLSARIYGFRTDAGFDNPSSTITRGRTEVGLKARYALSKNTALSSEAIFSEDVVTHGNRKGVIFNLEHAINSFLKGELGVRYAKESATASQTVGSATLTPTENTSIRVKLGMQLPFYSKLGLFSEYEQSVNSIGSRSVAVGGDYQVAPQTRLYVRHELISSLSGQFSLNDSQQRNTTLFGVESEYMKDGHLFSEYRLRDSVSGRDAEAAIGLRNGWQLTPGIRLNTNAERITTLGGSTSNDSTALGVGLEYTCSNLWKGTTRLEYRTSHDSESYLGTLGLAHKYNRSITLLGRDVVSYSRSKGSSSGERIDQRTQIGLAYRPVDSNRFNLLSKYEFRYESDDTNPATPSLRMVHILSANVNLQATRALVLTGRYAGKLVRDDSGSISSRSAAHMVTGHLTCDLTKKWDAGLNVMSLFNNGMKSMLYGAGAEVGYLLTANLWLSAGYNIFGFYDKDLSGENYTNPGFFMRMRFKFDEHLLDGIRNKTLNDGPQP